MIKGKRIVIAGGSGFIGQELVRYFSGDNSIIVLGRQNNHAKNNRNNFQQNHFTQSNVTNVYWDAVNDGEWRSFLENADLLINLTGKTVNCRYTRANKNEIMQSRINAVNALGNAIRNCKHPPKLWMNASSATIYRHANDRPQDERNGEYGKGFSVDVCQQWEKSFYDQDTPNTRKVALRMAITIGTGGVLIPYFNLLKFGLGGKQGPGTQRYSWIHIEDTCRIIEFIEADNSLAGTFNLSAPNPITNSEFMSLLRKATGTRIGLPAPTLLLKAGAMLIGTETELVLKSRWVLPARLQEGRYNFKFPLLAEAFSDILRQVPENQYKLF